jgi:hypothetical protein
MKSMESGCSWCSVLYKPIFGGSREPLPPSPLHEPGTSADLGKIFLTLNPNNTCTPQGRNLYHYSYRQSTNQRSYYLYTISMSTKDHNLAANCVTARGIETDVTISNSRSQIFRSFNGCAEHKLCPREQKSPSTYPSH